MTSDTSMTYYEIGQRLARRWDQIWKEVAKTQPPQVYLVLRLYFWPMMQLLPPIDWEGME